jgi:hypothetical protein
MSRSIRRNFCRLRARLTAEPSATEAHLRFAQDVFLAGAASTLVVAIEHLGPVPLLVELLAETDAMMSEMAAQELAHPTSDNRPQGSAR